jgi:deoxyribonuclease V
METGGHQGEGVFAAVDVHYLPDGGARAAAVVAADAAFSRLADDRIAVLPEVAPYQPGLGARAHEELGVPVIGVAKTLFRTATHAVPVLRGGSARPLYVTAAGMHRADAADLVRRMAGPHRLPDALRRVDTLARHGLPAAP